MMAGVNDSLSDAERVLNLKEIPAKVNLISTMKTQIARLDALQINKSRLFSTIL